jgi:spore coat polysaccharide biosynthesis protein SpsF
MGSTRLPGKVLKEILGKSLLEHQTERIRRIKLFDEIVIATTVNGADDVIEELCGRLSLSCFRGPEEDVLARYHAAAMVFHADVVVRLTSDCPVIDPDVVERVLQFYLGHSAEFDYVSNVLPRTYPRGMDTEVFPFRVLDTVFHEATLPRDREHVTPFIYRNRQRFRLANMASDIDLSRHRWTVDTEEDFALIRRIIEELYPGNPAYGMADILGLFDRDPGLFLINAHVEQKGDVH